MVTRGDVIELYDLSNDIRETNNIVERYPEIAKEMKAAIDKWKSDVRYEWKKH